MNKTQKIIITLYLILSPTIGFCSAYFLTAIDNGEAVDVLFGGLFLTGFCFIFLGVIAFILYKIWAD